MNTIFIAKSINLPKCVRFLDTFKVAVISCFQSRNYTKTGAEQKQLVSAPQHCLKDNVVDSDLLGFKNFSNPDPKSRISDPQLWIKDTKRSPIQNILNLQWRLQKRRETWARTWRGTWAARDTFSRRKCRWPWCSWYSDFPGRAGPPQQDPASRNTCVLNNHRTENYLNRQIAR